MHLALMILASLPVVGFTQDAREPIDAVLPTGRWEGEIRDPRRPVVINLNVEARTVSFSGAAPVPLVTFEVTPEGRLEFRTRVLQFNGARIGDRIEGDVKMSDASQPFRLDRLPDVPPPANRVEAWRQDLTAVTTRFLRYDRSFTDQTRRAAQGHIEQLKDTVGRKDDAHVIVELARIIASSGNAHTRLYLVRNRSELRRLPIHVWWFHDDLRIVAATNPYTSLLGCSIGRIGDTSVATAAARVRGIKAGNDSWQRYMSTYFLTSPDVLAAAGVLKSAERVPLGVSCGRSNRQVNVDPMPLHRSNDVTEAWWDLAPSVPRTDGPFVFALNTALPRYLRNADRNYWFEYVPEDNTIYFQYNRAEQMRDAPMAEFTAQLARAVDEHAVKRFVVDVRFNTGGDLYVGTSLVETLAKKLAHIPVFVLTGRTTFSAGITHAAQWKQLAGATIIGERVGDALDTWSEGGNLVLPNSGLTVHYGNAFHSYSRREYPDRRPYFFDLSVDSLEPSVVIEPTWMDYIQGKDPVSDAARMYHTR